MRKNERPPIKQTAHDAGFEGAFDVAPQRPPEGSQPAPTPVPVSEAAEGAKRGRPPGRNRHTHSVSMADAAYQRIMRAVAAEGLEFSEFMEKAGLRLVDVLEERRGSPYPPQARAKSVLDDL